MKGSSDNAWDEYWDCRRFGCAVVERMTVRCKEILGYRARPCRGRVKEGRASASALLQRQKAGDVLVSCWIEARGESRIVKIEVQTG